MATVSSAATCTDQEIIKELRSGLQSISGVRSAFFLNSESAISVWVDIANDEQSTRDMVYDFEDRLSDRFEGLLFDFHVVPVPPGRKMEDFIHSAKRIFQRAA